MFKIKHMHLKSLQLFGKSLHHWPRGILTWFCCSLAAQCFLVPVLNSVWKQSTQVRCLCFCSRCGAASVSLLPPAAGTLLAHHGNTKTQVNKGSPHGDCFQGSPPCENPQNGLAVIQVLIRSILPPPSTQHSIKS